MSTFPHQQDRYLTNFSVLSRLKQGTIIKVTNGEEFAFERLKQQKFIAKSMRDNKFYDIQVTSFKEVVLDEKGQPKMLETDYNAEGYKTLKPNELFFIDDNKGNAMLFKFVEVKNNRIVGINPINGRRSRIDIVLYRGKVSEIK